MDNSEKKNVELNIDNGELKTSMIPEDFTDPQILYDKLISMIKKYQMCIRDRHDYFAALYAAVFGKIIVLERPLLSYRQHGDNSVGAKNNNNIFYLAKRLGQGRRSYKNAMKESEDQIAFFVSLYKDEDVYKRQGL